MRRFTAGVFLFLAATHASQAAKIEGKPRVWHPMALAFSGPKLTESANAPNPFLDFRLQVEFRGPDGRTVEVPGFFDGDGEGGSTGNVWRARFTPDRPGRWSFRASFRTGPGVAIETGGTATGFDGESGEFEVAPLDPSAPGVLKFGRLEYVGKHYLKFKDGPYWIKGGCDEPENLLAYSGFDRTPPSHRFADHVADWKPGDPDWGDGKGKALIGALNYLRSRHVNSIYFLTMNVGGDGEDVWPWSGRPAVKGARSSDHVHFDVGKLRQWNIVFEHAQRVGLVLHFVFNEAEAENKKELDQGELGPERKLYYREMIARFGHHPAIEWNLCEEYNLQFDLGADRVRRFADFVRETDPYGHPVTVHSAGDPTRMLAFTFGDSRFGMTSVQLNQRRIDLVTESIRAASKAAGRPLPASMDEFTVDRGQKASHIPVDDPDGQRMEKLWPTYLSGGMIEFILQGLLKVDSFKTKEREAIWDQTWYARRFLESFPFWEMEPRDELTRGGATIKVGIGGGKSSPMGPQVLALPGRFYALYYPDASRTGELDLGTAAGKFRLRWYNPRDGEYWGPTQVVRGGGWVSLGSPPFDANKDWAVSLVLDEGRLESTVFPGKSWEFRQPIELGLDQSKLDVLAAELGGRGCVVKNGYVVKSWGDQSVRRDWASSAKPVLSTLLLFGIKEGKVQSVDQPIAEFGWELKPKDLGMTFRHLGAMTSGYARPEKPGAAWAYNDFAINLYQKTLFDRVFKGDPDVVANAPERFGALGLEDGLVFRKTNRRLSASVRDFARLDWFWLNRGRFGDRRLLPAESFDLLRPQVPPDLPGSAPAETDDYLKIGTYGGGSDHFSKAGPGIYGFNFWFNGKGNRHPDAKTWPSAPDDTVMTLGVRGNCSAFVPSLNAVLVAAEANWGEMDPGNPRGRQNQVLAQFVESVTPAR